MTSAPTTASDLLALFFPEQDRDYRDHVFLKDAAIGFSIQRAYPTGIRFKPARGEKGDDDVAVLWVVYGSSKTPPTAQLIPLRLRIATLSKYRTKHWDYDFKDEEGPTEESVIASRNSPRPLEMSLNDEYYYSKEQGHLVDTKNTPVTGRQILDRLFVAHCDSVHPIRGIRWRAPHRFMEFIRWFLDQPIRFLQWTLTFVFGRTLEERPDRSAFLDGYLRQDFKKVSIDSIEVAGYRAAKRVVVMFIVVVALGCSFLIPPKSGTYLESLLNSEFLLAMHGLGLLLILDEVLPAAVFRALNHAIKIRKIFLNWQLKNAFR